jgi:hypothetical protein
MMENIPSMTRKRTRSLQGRRRNLPLIPTNKSYQNLKMEPSSGCTGNAHPQVVKVSPKIGVYAINMALLTLSNHAKESMKMRRKNWQRDTTAKDDYDLEVGGEESLFLYWDVFDW